MPLMNMGIGLIIATDTACIRAIRVEETNQVSNSFQDNLSLKYCFQPAFAYTN